MTTVRLEDGYGEGADNPKTEGHLPCPAGEKTDSPAGEAQKRGEGQEEVGERGGVWSAKDRERIAAEGLTLEEADRQLEIFRRGVPPVRLNRPCRAGDGIVVISGEEKAGLLAAYEAARRTRRLIKFVPASGAATRMFKEWYRALEGTAFAEESEREGFLRDLRRYAFFPDLAAVAAAKGKDLEALIGKRDTKSILNIILTEEGLQYGRLPKALLKFHAYPGGSRTALEEHLVEAALYARDSENVSRLHFTVSPEHERAVRELLSRIIGDYESRLDTVVVDLTTQDPATNTLAADPKHGPFRDERGELVFRPGGHGALRANRNVL